MEVKNELTVRTIDAINDVLFSYRNKDGDIFPDHDHITNHLYSKIDSRMDLDTVEDAVFIMKELGYVKLESDKDDRVTQILPTSKGLLMKVNGGMSKEVERTKKKDKLYFWGQIAIGIAGIYYLIEILKNFSFLFSCH